MKTTDGLKQELNEIQKHLDNLNSTIAEMVEQRTMLETARFEKMAEIRDSLQAEIDAATKQS